MAQPIVIDPGPTGIREESPNRQLRTLFRQGDAKLKLGAARLEELCSIIGLAGHEAENPCLALPGFCIIPLAANPNGVIYNVD